ncbi:MAG: HAD-IA family hydrolase, partial [Actinomycetota bacterium]
MRRFKAVFFDAGETLVHPHPSFPELFAQILADHDVQVAPEVVASRLSEVTQRFKDAAESNELWSTDPERSKAFWLSVYRMFLDGAGVAPDRGLDVVLYEAFSDHANYALFDDVVPALEALAADGYDLGLISNFEDWLEVLLERLDLTRYFPVRVISGVVGIEKPDPQIFRLALEQVGVAAADAVYVG